MTIAHCDPLDLDIHLLLNAEYNLSRHASHGADKPCERKGPMCASPHSHPWP